MNVFEQLAEFHDKFQLRPYSPGNLGKPHLLDEKYLLLRARFIGEELNEFVEASMEEDLPHILRELVDIIYVAVGTIDLHGFTPAQAKEAFDRVHAANMAKIRVKDPLESKRGTLFDVRKPEDWKPPQLDDLCERSKA